MPESWTRLEVETTVADYFAMLGEELRGHRYNKAAHRRLLKAKLTGRSDPAIERKHQNISAILIELGFVYIPGYKPLGNYQRLLLEVVASRLEEERELSRLLGKQVQATVSVPGVEDILDVLESPPTPVSPSASKRHGEVRDLPEARRGVNYLELEARNRSLGLAGERFVVNFEVARLMCLGKDGLADKVELVSETRGDGLGFDVLSFEANGRDRLIEVKTTAYGSSTPFFVTSNEVRVSARMRDSYHLYRAFNFRSKPRLFIKSGSIEREFALAPSQYVAMMA